MHSDPAQLPADRLALLYRLTQTFNSSLDLDEVLNRVIDEVIGATRAERGFIMLREAGGSLGFRAARGMDHETIDHPEFQISRSIVEQVAHSGEPMLADDAQSDDRFSTGQSVVSLNLRSIVCVPLKTKDKVSGVVYVDNRLQSGIFGPPDLELLSAIASSAAVAVENARLYQVAVEKGRLERELSVARRVQSSFLPRHTPQMPGWEFAALWRPARQVSGDFYDSVPCDDDHLGLVFADVSDKGMPAALFMALSRNLVRASVRHAPTASAGISRANRLICADASDGMFVTLFFARINPRTGNVDYVSAGHDPPLLYCRDEAGPEEPLTELMPTGMALGILPEAVYEERTIHLHRGDFVLFYTDGVTDATNPEQQRFGRERMRRVVLDNLHAPAAGIVATLETAIDRFTGSEPQFDDIALVLAKRTAR